MTNTSNGNARRYERVQVVMPIRLAGQSGFTRDISVGGFYLEVDDTDIHDGEVCFELDLGAAHRTMKMKCRGQVVRTEHIGGLIGVAVKIRELQLLVN
jgi:hypothetical protein